MGALFNTVVGESLNLIKKMNKDDWKKVEEVGKDLASNIFSRKKKEVDVNEVEININEGNESKSYVNDYLEEFISCYSADSEISSGERRLLDKLAKSLGISVEKAKEIEDKYIQDLIRQTSNSSISLTQEEKEYLEEFKACKENDSEISSGERRLLNKLRIRSGISEERCKELELMAVGKFYTENEKEYYVEVKNCIVEDGEITESARRLLKKLRNSLNISKERAKEIEEIIEEEDY